MNIGSLGHDFATFVHDAPKNVLTTVKAHPLRTAAITVGGTATALALSACTPKPRDIGGTAAQFVSDFDTNHDGQLNTQFEGQIDTQKTDSSYIPGSCFPNGDGSQYCTPGFYDYDRYVQHDSIKPLVIAAYAASKRTDNEVGVGDLEKVMKTFDTGNTDEKDATKRAATVGDGVLEGSEVTAFDKAYGEKIWRTND